MSAEQEDVHRVPEWREYPLGDLVEIYDGPHATPTKKETGPIFLGISNLSRGRLDLSSTEHLSEEDFVRWTRRVAPRSGDIVFSYETRLGEAAIIPPSLRCCLGRRMGLLRVRPGRVDPRFLLYAYLGPEFQEMLRARTIHGSTVDRIPLIDMPEFPIQIPSNIDEQHVIGQILGMLDDKIELNRRMNETLEAMARAIFKSWFVDFLPVRAKAAARTQTGDPVRAKAEGRDPGLPKHIADLFPDRFEDSELGEIPAGWKIGNVGGFASLSCNGINPGGFPDETFEHFSIPAFDEGQTPKCELGGAIKSNKYLIPPDAVLLSKLNPRIPRLWLPVVRHNRRAVCSTEFLVVSPRAEASREFIYGFLSSEAFADVFETFVTGTSGSHQRVKPEGLLSMNVVLPDKSVIDHFSKVVQPLLARMDRAREESQTLAALRDTLLPKLISGDLRLDRSESDRNES